MYGEFVAMVDAMVGRVHDALASKGLLDQSLLIFTSDNGPVWLEEDVARYGHDSSGGLRGMKGDAWESGHRMPFIVRWPGAVAPGTTSSQLIAFTDLLATFAALTGAALPDGEGPDSFNFLPVLRGEQPENNPVRPNFALQSGGGAMTVRMGNWKYIDSLGSGGFSQPRKEEPAPGGPTGQLYNLADDPGETNNRFLDQPDITAKLQAELARIQGNRQTRP
jgi:arylsulfatase A